MYLHLFHFALMTLYFNSLPYGPIKLNYNNTTKILGY